ncbi:hypothetical protein GEMRC1_011918 [Eukaryota sp. GEM-RC1]
MLSPPPTSVFVVCKPNEESLLLTSCILRYLSSHDLYLFVEPDMVESFAALSLKLEPLNTDKGDMVDLVVTVGGDGTVIHASSYFPKVKPLFIPIHTGSLGFLSSFNHDEYELAISSALSSDFKTTLRYCLSGNITKNNRHFTALNEVSIERSRHISRWSGLIGTGSVLEMHRPLMQCYCDNKLINTVVADGLLIVTTTGSTAYSLSAGGACVHPEIPAILITPICPVSRCSRPILLPGTAKITVKVLNCFHASLSVFYDGNSLNEVHEGDVVEVTLDEFPVRTICKSNSTVDWFTNLETSFAWNNRVIQKR